MKIKEVIEILKTRKYSGISIIDTNFMRRADAAYKRNLAEPGDCVEDNSLLIGLSIAEAEIGQRPRWIPKVQKIGCEIATILDTRQSRDRM